jgi:hypothetical protein
LPRGSTGLDDDPPKGDESGLFSGELELAVLSGNADTTCGNAASVSSCPCT